MRGNVFQMVAGNSAQSGGIVASPLVRQFIHMRPKLMEPHQFGVQEQPSQVGDGEHAALTENIHPVRQVAEFRQMLHHKLEILIDGISPGSGVSAQVREGYRDLQIFSEPLADSQHLFFRVQIETVPGFDFKRGGSKRHHSKRPLTGHIV
jgi:hypothetical protein